MAKILAVDDSPSMRKLVEMTLRSAGHTVVLAEDGEEALTLAQQGPSDVVITDVHMPKKNGIELVGDLRSLTEYRYTPILVLTTESSEDMKAKGKEAGATGWIVKPFDPEKLLGAISRILPATEQ